MRTKILYRAAAVLLVLFALGHQVGFRRVDPAWHADAVVHAMQSAHFTVEGFDRTYWQFFSGFGFFVTVLLLFSAVFAWQVGSTSSATRRALLPALWAFAVAYVALVPLTLANFFAVPDMFTVIIALVLIAATLSGHADARRSTGD